MNLRFWGLQDTPENVLKMELLGLAKNAFPAYSYGHELS